MRRSILMMILGSFFLVSVSFGQSTALHGPIIRDAKRALAQGSVVPVLKWIKAADEAKIKEAFNETLKERKQNKEAADKRFFEILIRAHQEERGEGKPHMSKVEPVIEQAGNSIETGSIENIKEYFPKEDLSMIQDRLNQVVEKRKHADESIEAGREFADEYDNFLKSIQSLSSEAAQTKR